MEPIFIFLCFLLLLNVIFFVRLIQLLYKINQRRMNPFKVTERRDMDVNTLIIIGSGGHTAEMIRLVSALGLQYSPRHYVMAKTDKTSEHGVHELEKNDRWKNKPYHIHRVPRSREVGQAYMSSVISTVYSILYSIPLVASIRPDVLLTNGPGTCIPLCAVAFLLKVLCIRDVCVVFVESICRVETLSLTGKLLYYFADHVLVQWPQLAQKYQRTTYIGRLV